MITSAQVRAARALIRWSAEDLAQAAKLGVATVRRAEAEEGPLSITLANADAIQRALEQGGVVFVFESEDSGAGVRLAKRETTAGLTRQIDAIEAHLANTSHEPPQTPKGGMERLERARKGDAVTKLKNKRTKLKK